MSEIPADIAETTNGIIARHNSLRGDELCVEIARALLAERERCARVAESAGIAAAITIAVSSTIRKGDPETVSDPTTVYAAEHVEWMYRLARTRMVKGGAGWQKWRRLADAIEDCFPEEIKEVK